MHRIRAGGTMGLATVGLTHSFAEISFAEVGELEQERLYLESEILSEYSFEDIVGKSAALRKVLEQVAIVAPTGSTVLLHGETGTGKELLARAIHNLSPRRQRAFVRLNCAAIPSGLVESELFGHEKALLQGCSCIILFCATRARCKSGLSLCQSRPWRRW